MDAYINITSVLFSMDTTRFSRVMRAFTSQAEGWVFKSELRQTLVVKTGNDSTTARRSAIAVSVTVGWSLKNPHFSFLIAQWPWLPSICQN